MLLNIFFLAALVLLSKSEDELVAVSLVVRHGQRMPLSFYPNDPYRNITFPSLNDLTVIGMKEMFGVGKWLRNRYSNFLSESYKPDEIYVRSIEFDRSLMTSETTLAGIYPPTGEQIWNPHILWQPIPIHSSAKSQDIITNMLQPCPNKIPAVAATLKKSPDYPEFIKRYGPLMEYLSEKSGEHITTPSLYPLFDTLYSEKSLGLPLPDWAEKVYPELEEAIRMYTKMNSLTPLERKIQIGPLITRILKQFDHAISGHDFGTTKTIYRKFMPYFGTEWLLYDLAHGLGVVGLGIPDYGAVYIFELRKNEKGYYVNMFYRNRACIEAPARPMHIDGESYNLDFNKFKKIAEPLLTNTTQWVQLCDKFVHANASVATGVPMS